MLNDIADPFFSTFSRTCRVFSVPYFGATLAKYAPTSVEMIEIVLKGPVESYENEKD